ncbi:MAG: glycosyltransferase family 2 protein [Candidatus Firestonebacteria bacterium]|nr:glycosyltransferase family 2 protein [Candidatus Firestonebacteria bacterium]
MEPVTVLMPFYNQENFVAEAIGSILNQTYPVFQFIIYDDGSTDTSLRRVQPFRRDPRVVVLAGKQNRGEAYARNRLLDVCQTKFACWQDSDDLSNRFRLEYQMKLAGHKKMVFSRWERFNTGTMPPVEKIPEIHGLFQTCFPSALFAVDKACRFDDTITLEAKIGVDLEWAERMQRSFEYSNATTPECLYFYRNHDARMSMVKKKILAEISPEIIRTLNYGALVNRIRPDVENQSITLNLPPVGRNLDFWLDEFMDGVSRVGVKGWVRLLEADMLNAEVYLAWVPLAGSGKVLCFETTANLRPDVSAHFVKWDLNNSGFSANINKTDLPRGTFQLGLVVKKEGKIDWQLTGKQIEILE